MVGSINERAAWSATKTGIKDVDGIANCSQRKKAGVRGEAAKVVSRGAVQASAILHACILILGCVIRSNAVLELLEVMVVKHHLCV